MFINMETFLGLLRQSCAKPGGTLDFDNVASKIQNSSDFGKQLIQRRDLTQRSRAGSTAAEMITMRLPHQNCVYTGGLRNCVNQNVYAEYTEESTEDDPIVRISGEADGGPFDFTCHINDIDPRNASYAEMSALYGHLVKTGKFGNANSAVTPYGYEFYGSRDMLKKQDFIAGISAVSESNRIDANVRADAKYMLGVYQQFMQGR